MQHSFDWHEIKCLVGAALLGGLVGVLRSLRSGETFRRAGYSGLTASVLCYSVGSVIWNYTNWGFSVIFGAILIIGHTADVIMVRLDNLWNAFFDRIGKEIGK